MTAARPLRPVPPLPADDDWAGWDDDTDDVLVDAEVLAADPPPAVRQPLRPPWATSRSALATEARTRAGNAGYTLSWYATRGPTTIWWQIARWSPWGVARFLASWGRWAFDQDGLTERRTVHAAVAGGAAPAALLTVRGEHRRTRRVRLAMSIMVILATALATLNMLTGHRPAVAALLAILVGYVASVMAGWHGRPADAPPIGGPRVRKGGPERLSSPVILAALAELGIPRLSAAIAADERAIRWETPVMTVDRLGWEVHLDHPGGVTAGNVIEKRAELAGNLRRPLDTVWPSPDHKEHPGRLQLFVARSSLSAGDPPAWPLLKAGAVNLFKPFPIGVDQRGRPVTVTLMLRGGLIGAKPRMGKSALTRLLATGAALDPRAEMHVFACKGGGDFAWANDDGGVSFADLAQTYCSTADMTRLGPVLVASLRSIYADLIRRGDVIAGLGPAECPDQQVTDALASRRELGLHPVLIIIDEAHNAMDDKEHGPEIASLIQKIGAMGPGLGYVLLLTTQRPDAKSIPKAISDLLGLRWCFKVNESRHTNMVLGDGAHGDGYRATDFSEQDKGVCWHGGDDERLIMRCSYLDIPTTARVLVRARDARARAGTLPRPVELDVEPVRSILEDVGEVWLSAEARIATQTLLARLEERWPERYAGWETGQLTDALKPYGLTVRPIRIGGEKPRGLERNAFHEVFVAHHLARETPSREESGR